ncbi:hypothetical protein C8R43DRAFT_956881 [Mycena crocata]|nr:hypothetical protein C8R43DRAFT_956881 [Mycena crocata]
MQWPNEQATSIADGMHRAFQCGILYHLNLTHPLEWFNVPALVPPGLSDEQTDVQDKIERHLLRSLLGEAPDQLLLLVHGKAGTGKTTIIEYIAGTFAQHGASPLLLRTATTSSGAGIIGGETLDGRLFDRGSREALDFNLIRYILIDQFSRISKTDMGRFSEALGCCASADANLPFGGLNVILFGDVLQPLPAEVADALHERHHQSDIAAVGADLFRRFNDVVTLHRALYISDPFWSSLLDRIRVARCTAADISILEERVIRPCPPPHALLEWEDATLMTTSPSFASVWNSSILRFFCAATTTTMHVSPACDICELLTDNDRRQLLKAPAADTANLLGYIEVAIGMRAFVNFGTATVFGTVSGVELDTREPPWLGDSTYRVLVFPLVHVLFTPHDSIAATTVPVTSTAFSWAGSQAGHVNVLRRQMEITPAYAVAGERVGGYHFHDALVDLTAVEGEEVGIADIHAILSKILDLSQLRILRPFQTSILTQGLSTALSEADARLQFLADRSAT